MNDPAARFHRSNARGEAPGGHYSHAVAAGGFVYISGQLPIQPGGLKDAGLPVSRQTEIALVNLRDALAAAGARLDQVIKVTAYITGEQHWAEFNAAYAAFFGDHRPARSVVPTGPLHYGFQVEIDAVAYVGGGAQA
jgi:reactive intermediate/imine deaminase